MLSRWIQLTGLIVSEKKADKLRYWLAFLLKDLDVGQTFKPDILHLTVVPWFVTQLPDAEIRKSFYQHFTSQKAFEISLGRQADFKNKRKVSINLIKPSRQILSLHQMALDWFSKTEARWAVQNPHVGTEFRPHVRRRPGHNLSAGETVMFSSLSLISARRRGDDERTVIAKVKFNE